MTPKNKNIFPLSYQQIPLFPIYGYDNSEEAEKDFEYMKHLYPRSCAKVQELIEETCDKLEYEGSVMFDEYPDRLQIALLAGKIYSQVVPSASETESAQATSLPLAGSGLMSLSHDRPAPPPGRPHPPGRPNHPAPPDRPMGPPPPPPGNQNPDWLRNMIEIMLCNEMCQRRRRYRSRKRWL